LKENQYKVFKRTLELGQGFCGDFMQALKLKKVVVFLQKKIKNEGGASYKPSKFSLRR
jgi:hypothetical protein